MIQPTYTDEDSMDAVAGGNGWTSLGPAARCSLAEHAARLKHDLGKYVAFRIRWLPGNASLAERRDALAADVLTTRRGPDGAQDAVSLWRDLRRVWVGEADLVGDGRIDFSADPSVREIDLAMGILCVVADELRAGEADEDAVRRGTEAALAVSDAARELYRRVREGRDEGQEP